MIVANDVTRVGAGFGSDDNAAVVLSRTGPPREFGLMPKRRLADELLTAALELARAGTVPRPMTVTE
jgi:phosphopantothenoylcysteine decarboxylase/phosphopantothenate--cysteine ligase